MRSYFCTQLKPKIRTEMKKYLLILAVSAFFASCGGNEATTEEATTTEEAMPAEEMPMDSSAMPMDTTAAMPAEAPAH